MSGSVIYKGFDNPVIFTFSFGGDFAALGLNNFTRVDVTIGNETYSTLTGAVVISSATELKLLAGDSTALNQGSYYPTIVGYNATYDDGYVLTKKGSAGLLPITVVV